MVTNELVTVASVHDNSAIVHVVLALAVFTGGFSIAANGELIAGHITLFIAVWALGIVAKEDRRIVEGSITDDNATSIVNAQFEKPLPLNGIQGNPAFQSLIVLEINIGLAADTNAAEDTWRHGIHGRRQGGIEMLGVVEDTIGPMVAVFEFRLATGGEKEWKEEEGKR